MAQARALLVGLTHVSSASYGSSLEDGIYGSELDVKNIQLILSRIDNFDIRTFLNEKAEASTILSEIALASTDLQKDDLFVFYFAGHGGQVADADGDEHDSLDETILSYDRQILDDELANLWIKFKSGVRLFLITDSCNSGTIYREGLLSLSLAAAPLDFGTIPGLKAELIHFAGSRDGNASTGYQSGGAFTTAMCNVWQDGLFEGDYEYFFSKIFERLTQARHPQRPQMNIVGNVSQKFLKSRPFSI
jgi:hypothetical protein